MKLKLEGRDDIKILIVTEELATQHAAILKAGLRKMFQTGVRKFVLDLSSIGRTTPEPLKSVADGARADSTKLGIRLLIVSALAEIADAPTVDEALKLFEGPSAPKGDDVPAKEQSAAEAEILVEEAQLQAQVRKLQRRKASLEQHLAKCGDQDVRTLKKEHSDLARSVERMERLVTALSARRRETAFLSSSERKFRRVTEILTAVLEQEGILPIK